MKSFYLLSILLFSVLSENPFWDNIQEDILTQNKLSQEVNETAKVIKHNNRTLEDEFINVDGDETVHMKNFKKISELSQETESLYIDCLKEIPNNDFSMKQIELCIGVESIFILNDFDYLIKSIIAIYESKIKAKLISDCYTVAGTDETFSRACGIFEDDLLDVLWMQFDFVTTVEHHKNKYTYEFANLSVQVFE